MAFIHSSSYMPAATPRPVARCPTMIRAPPARPPAAPSAAPARIQRPPPKISDPAAAAAAAALAAAATAAPTTSAPNIAPNAAPKVSPPPASPLSSPAEDEILRTDASTTAPAAPSPTTTTTDKKRTPSNRANSAMPRVDGRLVPRPDGAQVANAAYTDAPDASPRELYYGSPLRSTVTGASPSSATVTKVKTGNSAVPTTAHSSHQVMPATRKVSRRRSGEAPATSQKGASGTQKARKSKKSMSEDSIRSYLHEIGEVKLLDAEVEIDLARQIARLLRLERISAKLKETTGVDPTISEWAEAAGMDIENFRDTLRRGLRAKEHMVAANLRLVVSIAKKYVNRGLTFQDLIQEGSIGLIRGAEKFDGDKGFKFSTYATWWIRQAITRAIADHSRPIRLPVHVNDTIAAIKKTTKVMHDELNRPPSEAELAARLQITVEKLRFLSRSSRSTISLETPIGRESKDSGATLGSFIMWEGDTPEETTMKTLLREDLENVLNTLSPRERDVVRMRYGFDDGKMKTLEEIGTMFAVTRERIRQIEAKALRKLRHPNRNAVLREYVYEDH